MNEQNPAQAQNHSLSFTKLTAMIIGSTIGGGIFTTAAIWLQAVRIPQCPHRLDHLRHRYVLPDDVLLRAQPRAPRSD